MEQRIQRGIAEGSVSAKTKKLTLTAMMTAGILILTRVLSIPMPLTEGYVTLGDGGIYFAAYLFGPVVGGLAGGLGTGLADILGGYAHWAGFSFLIHGAQGVIAGYLGRKGTMAAYIGGIVVGGIVMVGGYFAAGAWMYGIPAAAAEIIGNTGQNIVGGMVGTALFYAVRHKK